ncbi:heavy-metal-associated domain-containing protein [Corynebacterium sp. HMSC28B08]|uniref:heavy-metal-associated domain-containing protein n=1 Tax=Corynebacterium TaxID=1716 RepID=UPI0008A5AE03|nr:heavy-metal-associated domain-containing protein [Corynebacterium sp. HMSC28B08]OFT90498.1 heavy metal transporter [Corynebacterium sp. HMSC28B08]
MSQLVFKVEGMSCGHCEAAVREEVSKIPGVTTISVSAQDGSLRVDEDGTVTPDAVIAAVDEAGYDATQVS